MPELVMVVDTALAEVPVNLLPLIDDTDFKSRETAVAFNQAGMDLVWNFVTTGGAMTQTAVTPTSGGTYDWAHQGDGMYSIEIPASGGASINNDTEGFGWFTGFATGILPWRGPIIQFSPANVVNALVNGSDVLEVDVTQANGDAASTTTGKFNVNVSTIDANAITASAIADNAIDAGALAADCITAAKIADNAIDAGAIASNAITSAKIAAGAITSSTFAAGAINAAAIAADAITDAKVASDVTIASVTGAVGSVTGAVGSVTGNVGGNVTGSVGSIATGGITTASFAAGAINAAAIAADAITDAKVASDVTIASVTGAVGSVTGNVGGNVVGSVGSVTTVSDKTGYRLSATGVDDILDEVVEGTTTLRESTRLANTANGGKTSGAATTTFTARDLADSKNRLSVTVDADGNRSAVTRDLT
jgi:hypothetical protein